MVTNIEMKLSTHAHHIMPMASTLHICKQQQIASGTFLHNYFFTPQTY